MVSAPLGRFSRKVRDGDSDMHNGVSSLVFISASSSVQHRSRKFHATSQTHRQAKYSILAPGPNVSLGVSGSRLRGIQHDYPPPYEISLFSQHNPRRRPVPHAEGLKISLWGGTAALTRTICTGRGTALVQLVDSDVGLVAMIRGGPRWCSPLSFSALINVGGSFSSSGPSLHHEGVLWGSTSAFLRLGMLPRVWIYVLVRLVAIHPYHGPLFNLK